MTERRFSRQREELYKNLASRYDHPTADMLYWDLKEEIPNLSLGTVYRNLTCLCEEGRAIRIYDGKKEHFDAVVTPHIHFLCTACGCVEDVAAEMPGEIYKMAETGGRKASFAEISIHGVCGRCLNAESQTK